MDDIDKFLEHYQPKLLSYLDSKTIDYSEEPGPIEFVEKVLDDWNRHFSGQVLRKPNSRERTFWFALYQLEDLVEYPVSRELDPYEGVLLENLAQVRELLREWCELPEGLNATRPGEYPDAL